MWLPRAKTTFSIPLPTLQRHMSLELSFGHWDVSRNNRASKGGGAHLLFLFLPSWNSSLTAEIEASLEARGRSQVLRQPKERRNPDLTALPSDQPGPCLCETEAHCYHPWASLFWGFWLSLQYRTLTNTSGDRVDEESHSQSEKRQLHHSHVNRRLLSIHSTFNLQFSNTNCF